MRAGQLTGQFEQHGPPASLSSVVSREKQSADQHFIIMRKNLKLSLAWIPIREDAANKIVTSSSESEPELLVAQPWDLHQFFIETRIEQERIMRPLLKLNGDFLALDGDVGVSVEKGAHRFPQRREEALCTQPREQPEALELVLDRILHLREAQLDALGVQTVVELHDDRR